MESPPPPSTPDETPDGTPDGSPPPDPGYTDEQATDTPTEQTTEIEEVTTALQGEKERAPEELASAVDTLISIVSAVETPETLAQDRQGVIESAENLASALAVISDPNTPRELKEELTAIVQQVTSTLEVVHGPRVPSESRSMLILVVKRTTSTLDLICDSKTPQKLRGMLIGIVKDTNYALERSPETRNGSTRSPNSNESRAPAQDAEIRMLLGSSSAIVSDRRTPTGEREKLADVTQQVSSLLRKATDPGTSQEERSEARKELDERTARMKDQQEESASAQERPEESLGKAAAVCTSAIFESTPESTLMRGMKRLVPAEWEDEGVKDFWKAQERSNDQLDVLAQLRNNEHSHAPFEVAPLITELAELVPHDKLFGSLGPSALSCEQTASYLDEEFGITVGTWLTKGGM
ncbi:hypothetical protein [Streptomyces cyaneogriseus]|uniref:hypothetical protein n=1 Tax=Streptomyces cyaneogriseus TaxID=68192 RepID=UPI001331333C|nr:hypothetical protein [Streptomyces cyaneogriseus]